jgi:hypothetical protein
MKNNGLQGNDFPAHG